MSTKTILATIVQCAWVTLIESFKSCQIDHGLFHGMFLFWSLYRNQKNIWYRSFTWRYFVVTLPKTAFQNKTSRWTVLVSWKNWYQIQGNVILSGIFQAFWMPRVWLNADWFANPGGTWLTMINHGWFSNFNTFTAKRKLSLITRLKAFQKWKPPLKTDFQNGVPSSNKSQGSKIFQVWKGWSSKCGSTLTMNW